MSQASRTRIYIPLEFATRAWHLAAEGEPLLREARASDVHTLLAYEESDGFALGLSTWDEEVSAIETFRDLAAFLGFSPAALTAVCKARGADALLPDPEDEDDSIADPYEYLDVLADLCPVPTLDEKMRELPEVFTLSPLDRLEALKARTTKLPDPLGHLELTEGYRPGDMGRYWSVPDVMSLSCLQWLLDKVKAKTVIALG